MKCGRPCSSCSRQWLFKKWIRILVLCILLTCSHGHFPLFQAGKERLVSNTEEEFNTSVHQLEGSKARDYLGVSSRTANNPVSTLQGTIQKAASRLAPHVLPALESSLAQASTQLLYFQKKQASKGRRISTNLKDRKAEFESIAQDVEAWAEAMLNESYRHGQSIRPGTNWTSVQCHRGLRNKLNPHGRTKQWVRWMVDSREGHADASSQQLHPCMKVYAEIDAPLDVVCKYLSQEKRYKEYNSLLVDQEDVEELTPYSKICWSQTKKLRTCSVLTPPQ